MECQNNPYFGHRLVHVGLKPASEPHYDKMEPQPASSMPVIIYHSLRNTAVSKCFTNLGLKVRVSETTSEGSVIFPASKVAFYYLHVTPSLLDHMDTPQQRSNLLHSINKFVEGHGHCYVVLETTAPCQKTFSLMEEIQIQHLHSRLQMILSHSANDAATAMVDIAKLQCRPLSDKMHACFCSLLNRLLLEDTFPHLLSSLGLNSSQQQLIQDRIGSLSDLAAASPNDLMDCALDSPTIEYLTHFFAARH